MQQAVVDDDDNFTIHIYDSGDDDCYGDGGVGDDGDDDDDKYIMVKCLSVCLSVTKNDHFLL